LITFGYTLSRHKPLLIKTAAMKKTLLLLLTLLTISLHAQENDTTGRIDALFASFHNDMPGVAVAVSIDGRLIYDKAFGGKQDSGES